MNEKLLFQKISEGDEFAFKIFFTANYSSLYAYVISHLGNSDQSEDITQQAFINFWTKRAQLDLTKSPRSYLYTIAYNLFLDTKRKEKIEYTFIAQMEQNAILEDNNDEELQKKIKKLKRVIDTLPDRCRTILILNKIEGLKYKEIAEQLDISIKTVETQMRIAFQKIREAFKN
jgi:RNA polymerase sigma-70 factor (family 1)